MKKSKNVNAEQMADLTFQLMKSCQAKEHYFAESNDLTSAEFRLLRHFKFKDAYSVKELAKQMNLTSGRITHIITMLEEKGFIIRDINPDDRRGINVRLSAKAKPLLEKISKKHTELHQEILERLPVEHREKLVESLKHFISAMNG